MRPNILFYFTDQQRADTLGCFGQKLEVSPRLDALAQGGVAFEHAFSPQPVCGPCRALFQTGLWPTQTGCFKNGVSLPAGAKTVAERMAEAGYDCAYVGKWHLASDDGAPGGDFTVSAIPPEKRGGYTGFWRAADVLEFTSHGYDGYVFDERMQRIDFTGYRADAIADFALQYLDQWDRSRPFFLTVSQIEPHHQNDRKHYEGPDGSKQRFKDFELPADLRALGGGDAGAEYPDYLGACRSLDDNLGRLLDRLRAMGQLGNTVIVFASDHGSHFKTRNRDANLCGADDYKRSCHDASLRVPLVIAGPGFARGKRVWDIVSTASLPKTFLAVAGADAQGLIGEDLRRVADGDLLGRENLAFAQISESRVGRCIRTPEWLYSVCAPGVDGFDRPGSDVYVPDFLYDLKQDPLELVNLAADPAYAATRRRLGEALVRQMALAGEEPPRILERQREEESQ